MGRKREERTSAPRAPPAGLSWLSLSLSLWVLAVVVVGRRSDAAHIEHTATKMAVPTTEAPPPPPPKVVKLALCGKISTTFRLPSLSFLPDLNLELQDEGAVDWREEVSGVLLFHPVEGVRKKR